MTVSGSVLAAADVDADVVVVVVVDIGVVSVVVVAADADEDDDDDDDEEEELLILPARMAAKMSLMDASAASVAVSNVVVLKGISPSDPRGGHETRTTNDDTKNAKTSTIHRVVKVANGPASTSKASAAVRP